MVAAARRLDRLDALANEVAGVVPVGCDVTDDSQLLRLVEVAAEHGGPDIVVNNAGTTDAVVRAHEQDPAQFRGCWTSTSPPHSCCRPPRPAR